MTKIFNCDRCGAQFDSRHGGNTARRGSKWWTLYIRQVRKVFIGAYNVEGKRVDTEPDMCGTCEDSLADWWEAGRVS